MDSWLAGLRRRGVERVVLASCGGMRRHNDMGGGGGGGGGSGGRVVTGLYCPRWVRRAG